MKSNPSFILFLLVIVSLNGCVGVGGWADPATKEGSIEKVFPLVAEEFRKKALGYEQKGDLQRALVCWKAASGSIPGSTALSQKIILLEDRIQKEAEQHFQKGLQLLEKDHVDTAQKEFITAMYLNPEHKDVLRSLQQVSAADSGSRRYVVKKGDSLQSIAASVYGDPDKDFLVAYFAGIPSDEQPAIGITFELPLLDPEFWSAVAKKEDTSPDSAYPNLQIEDRAEDPLEVEPAEKMDWLAQANTLLNMAKYEEVISALSPILENEPTNQDALQLRNTASLKWSRQLLKEGEYEKALAMLEEVHPGFNGLEETRNSIQAAIQDIVQNHYQRGVKYFVNEELQKAITEWQKALDLDPYYEKARTDISRAENLLKRLEEYK